VDRIPRVEGVSSLEAANSGEEYEIVATAPAIDTEAFVAEFGLASPEVGRVVADLRESSYSGRQKNSAPPGFDHFRDK